MGRFFRKSEVEYEELKREPRTFKLGLLCIGDKIDPSTKYNMGAWISPLRIGGVSIPISIENNVTKENCVETAEKYDLIFYEYALRQLSKVPLYQVSIALDKANLHKGEKILYSPYGVDEELRSTQDINSTDDIERFAERVKARVIKRYQTQNKALHDNEKAEIKTLLDKLRKKQGDYIKGPTRIRAEKVSALEFLLTNPYQISNKSRLLAVARHKFPKATSGVVTHKVRDLFQKIEENKIEAPKTTGWQKTSKKGGGNVKFEKMGQQKIMRQLKAKYPNVNISDEFVTKMFKEGHGQTTLEEVMQRASDLNRSCLEVYNHMYADMKRSFDKYVDVLYGKGMEIPLSPRQIEQIIEFVKLPEVTVPRTGEKVNNGWGGSDIHRR